MILINLRKDWEMKTLVVAVALLPRRLVVQASPGDWSVSTVRETRYLAGS